MARTRKDILHVWIFEQHRILTLHPLRSLYEIEEGAIQSIRIRCASSYRNQEHKGYKPGVSSSKHAKFRSIYRAWRHHL